MGDVTMIHSRDSTTRPAADRVTIHEGATERDLFYLARQWHHYFGTRYESNRLPRPLADVLGWIDDDADDKPLATHALVAEHAGVQVGGGLVLVLDHGAAVDELPDGRFDADALAGDRNGWLSFGVVDPAWRGQGIGRRLFDRRLEWLRSEAVDMVFGLGWERDGDSSRPLFESRGFVPVQRFEAYYGSEDAPRTACPDCGVWPSDDSRCRCATTLWALDGGVDWPSGGRDA